MARERDALYTSPRGMAIDAPWSRRRWAGPALDVGQVRPAFAVQSRFSGAVLVAMPPRAAVARLLAADLELADPVAAGEEGHPVVIAFGTHRHCAALLDRRPVGSAPDYRELIVAVPYVRRRGRPWLHVCVPCAHSDAAMTVWNGNVHYGFTKHASSLTWRDELLLVTGAGGALACHGAVAPAGEGAATEPQGFADLRSMLGLPTIGDRIGAGPVSAYFDWQVAAERIRPARGWFALDQPVGTLPSCEWQAAPGGAFVVHDLLWRLSWPQPVRG